MAKKTKQQEAIDWLMVERGMFEIPSKSRKYRVLTKHDRKSYYLVGKCGAVRVNHHKPTITGSISITERFKKLI